MLGSWQYNSNYKHPHGNGCEDKEAKDFCITRDNYQEMCSKIKSEDSNTTQLVRDACQWVFKNNYHWNNGIKQVRRVQCPKNLMLVTGLKRFDTSLPIVGDDKDKDRGWIYSTEVPNPENKTWTIGNTTMEDGCKPTCSNDFDVTQVEFAPGKTDLDPNYNAMYSCDYKGNIIIDDK